MTATIHPQREDERRTEFEPGQDFAVMLVAVLLGAFALWQANSLLNIDDPPAAASQPVLSLVLDPAQRLPWAKNSEYQVLES